jgi:tripartite-type tricarboxylate transporter receptor subunit TctC
LGLLWFVCGIPAGLAQSYPNKTIHFIMPYPVGGSIDIAGRMVMQKVAENLGQPVVIDNRTGAGGIVGTEMAAHAPADGYTLVMGGNGTLALSPHLQRNLPYDPLRDFAPVAQCALYQYVLVTRADAPYKSIGDLVAAARANPGGLAYGSTGIGGGNHLAAELFGLASGTRFNHIPYKGSAPALADLLGGQLTFMFDTVITSVPQIRGGKLRAFAVSAGKRASSLPEVPTMQEAGFAGFDLSQWQGVLAPAGTPRAVVQRLNSEIARAMHAPEVHERIAVQGGNEIVTGTPEEFAALIRAEFERYGRLIRDAKISAQ